MSKGGMRHVNCNKKMEMATVMQHPFCGIAVFGLNLVL